MSQSSRVSDNVRQLGRPWHGPSLDPEVIGIGSWWRGRTRAAEIVRVNKVNDDGVSFHMGPNHFGGVGAKFWFERFEPFDGAAPAWWKPSMRRHDEGYLSRADKRRIELHIEQTLRDLGACAAGLDEVRDAGSMRAAWQTSTSLVHMSWLLKHLLSSRRLARVMVRCAETVAHIMPADALPFLADVGAWAGGDDDVDLRAASTGLTAFRLVGGTHADRHAVYAVHATVVTASYWQRRLCVEVLEPLRAMVGRPIFVSSGYRSPMLNTNQGYIDAMITIAASVAAADPDLAYADARAALCNVIRDEVDADEIYAAIDWRA